MEKDVQLQIQELEDKIQSLRSTRLQELRRKLDDARRNVTHLEAELAKLTGHAPAANSRRKRTPSEDVHHRIVKALSEAPEGLSQKEISDRTELNYNTVVIYLKNHKKDFKSTGTLRAKRFFLK